MQARQSLGLSWFFMILALSLLTACATNKLSDLYVLKPVETADLSKRFTYGYAIRGPGGGQQGGGSESSSRNGQSRERPGSFEDMREELENTMAVIGYCTEGYFVYDETFNGNQYLLHGECQESDYE